MLTTRGRQNKPIAAQLYSTTPMMLYQRKKCFMLNYTIKQLLFQLFVNLTQKFCFNKSVNDGSKCISSLFKLFSICCGSDFRLTNQAYILTSSPFLRKILNLYCNIVYNKYSLTKVRFIGAAFQANSFLRALNQEVPHQLIGQVPHCTHTHRVRARQGRKVYCIQLLCKQRKIS